MNDAGFEITKRVCCLLHDHLVNDASGAVGHRSVPQSTRYPAAQREHSAPQRLELVLIRQDWLSCRLSCAQGEARGSGAAAGLLPEG